MERAIVEMLGQHPALAIAVTDADGRLSLTTPGLERMLGRRVDDLTERELESLRFFDPEEQRWLDRAETPLIRALRGEVVIDQVVGLRRPDDQMLFLRCNAAPLRERDAPVHGAIALVQDVTRERVSARKQSELRDRLVTTVSHELRTPLTKILGHAELLTETEGLPPEVARSVAAIARAGQDLARMAEKLSHLTRLEEATRVRPGPADMVVVLRRVVDEQQAAAAARRVGIELSAPSAMHATIDAALVARAAHELIVNAVTHAPLGSRVAVDLVRFDGLLEIRVADQGQGVPLEDRDRVVLPFERGENPPGSVSTSGLGLAVVSAIAAAHGGTVRLDDNEPQGLIARMSLRRHLN